MVDETSEDVLAICDLGHRFMLKDFGPIDEKQIAAISSCPEMVASNEHGGLILECGARVLWLKNISQVKRGKKFAFTRPNRSDQFDLFDEMTYNSTTTNVSTTSQENLPLDKSVGK